MAAKYAPDEEELREALFGTHPKAAIPHAVRVPGMLAIAGAAFWCGMLAGTVRCLAGKAHR